MPKITLESAMLEAADKAGNEIRKRAFEIGQVDWKGKDDPVTELDKLADEIIIDELGRFGGNVVSEERPEIDKGDALTWYVDPIDGTKSLLKGQYLSAISIGAEYEGKGVGAIVYDFMRDIAYVATEKSLFRMRMREGNRYPFRVKHGLSKKKVLTGDRGIPEEISDYLAYHKYEPDQRIGSIALAMAHVAIGTYDAYATGVATRGFYWDVAAGLYLMQRSGLAIMDRHGRPVSKDSHKNGIIAIPQNHAEAVSAMLDMEAQNVPYEAGGYMYNPREKERLLHSTGKKEERIFLPHSIGEHAFDRFYDERER